MEYPSNELSAALDRGLIRCRGNWIGYATLHSKYTPLFFASLCSWLSPNQFEYIAVSTDLILTGGTLPKANGNIKPGTIHQLGLEQQRNIPFLTVQNTFFPKQSLCRSATSWHANANVHYECAELAFLDHYLSSNGNGKICVASDIAVATNAAASTALFPLGYPVNLKSDRYLNSIVETSKFFGNRNTALPPWLQIRIAYTVLNFHNELLLKRRSLENLSSNTKAKLEDSLRVLYSYVDFKTVDVGRQALAKWNIRYGVQSRYKGVHPNQVPVHLDGIDSVSGLIKLKWFTTIEETRILQKWIGNRA
ncbi:hypothetical protein ACFQAT_05780 [Undibacterium arcticum]|uniref:hypothetical protein n=1 Tax=Undibacterium arcticum TaxID=1762892 RepID=UPI003614AC65